MRYRKLNLFHKRASYHLGLLITSMIIAVCSLTAGSIFFAGRTKAAENMRIYKYYTSVKVKNGDTLWGIASEYGTEEYDNLQEYVSEIKSLNGLKGDTIHSGRFLIVPYYSSERK